MTNNIHQTIYMCISRAAQAYDEWAWEWPRENHPLSVCCTPKPAFELSSCRHHHSNTSAGIIMCCANVPIVRGTARDVMLRVQMRSSHAQRDHHHTDAFSLAVQRRVWCGALYVWHGRVGVRHNMHKREVQVCKLSPGQFPICFHAYLMS